jgi:hypothetical protein
VTSRKAVLNSQFRKLALANLTVSRMHTWRYPLLRNNSSQYIVQTLFFLFLQSREQVMFKLNGQNPDSVEGPAACLRQIQPVAPAISGVAAPVNQLAVFEIIEQYNEAAGKHPQHRAQLLLRNARIASKNAEYAGVVGLKAKQAEPTCKTKYRVGTHLRQEKRHPHRGSIRDGALVSHIVHSRHD